MRHATPLLSLLMSGLFACGGAGSSDGAGGSGGGAGTGSGPSASSATGGPGATSTTGAGAGAPCAGDATVHEGEGTYYDADGSGNCSFPASPGDLRVAAMNEVDYAGSAACGGCIRATGPDGEVIVRIVDRCPECPQGDVDFSPEAFAELAPLDAGRVPISWQWVACDVAGPISYHFKDGSSEFWTAIQVRDHRYRIATLEWLDPEGNYVEVPRLEYNYFVRAEGMGPGPLTLRVTDVHGGVIVSEGVPVGDDTLVAGAAQLPACEGG